MISGRWEPQGGSPLCKRRAEQHHNTARADDDDDGDPYGDHSTKQAKPEIFALEVSALEAGPSYMTLRSSKRKFQAPLPGPVVQPGAPLEPNPVVQRPAEPAPDTSHEDPKHFAHRLFDLGGPSASRGISYQTNKEGLLPSDDADEYPSRYEDPEFYYDSDERYEDQ